MDKSRGGRHPGGHNSIEKGPVIYGENLYLDSRMMSRRRGPWPQACDRPFAGELRAHPLYATEIRQSFVSFAIEQASAMSDEDLFDFAIPDHSPEAPDSPQNDRLVS